MDKSGDEKTKKRMSGKKKAFLIAGLVLCIGVIIFCAIQLISILGEYNEGNKEYAALESVGVSQSWLDNYTSSEEVAGTSRSETTLGDISAPSIDWAALKKKNPDVIAWMVVPGTTINYPITQTDNNDKYLHYTFENIRNKNGSVFMDYRCSGDFSDVLTVIYGHNMKSGAMFHQMTQYKDEKFMDSHREILIFTPKTTLRLRVVGAFAENPQDVKFKFGMKSADELAEYYKKYVTDKCSYALKMPEGEKQLFTFMTCSYEFDNARTFVQAVPWFD